MQIEQSPLFKYNIQNYQNRRVGVRVNDKFPPLELYLYEDYLTIRFASQQKVLDLLYFRDLTYCQIRQFQGSKQQVIIIREKAASDPNISFRHNEYDVGQMIYHFINKKITLGSTHANHTETLYHRKNIYLMIYQRQPHIYKSFYNPAIQTLFQKQWMDSVLFEDHELVKEFNLLALQRGVQKERKLILSKAKYKAEERPSLDHSALEFNPKNLDVVKCDDGMRFYDDLKKVKFQLKEEDKQDDIIGEELPEIRREQIFQNLDRAQIKGELMDIQSEGTKLVPMQSDRTTEPAVRLPKADKTKFTLFQRKQYYDKDKDTKIKEAKPREDPRQFRGDLETKTVKARLWMKVYYRAQSHSQATIAHIDTISEELNKLLLSQPKFPLYVENAVKKTLSNALAWKRAKGMLME